MKATLSFNLNDPDDYCRHLRCIKSLDLALALLEIERLIKKLEHLYEVNPEVDMDVVDFLKNEYSDILVDKSISLDELIS